MSYRAPTLNRTAGVAGAGRTGSETSSTGGGRRGFGPSTVPRHPVPGGSPPGLIEAAARCNRPSCSARRFRGGSPPGLIEATRPRPPPSPLDPRGGPRSRRGQRPLTCVTLRPPRRPLGGPGPRPWRSTGSLDPRPRAAPSTLRGGRPSGARPGSLDPAASPWRAPPLRPRGRGGVGVAAAAVR